MKKFVVDAFNKIRMKATAENAFKLTEAMCTEKQHFMLYRSVDDEGAVIYVVYSVNDNNDAMERLAELLNKQ